MVDTEKTIPRKTKGFVGSSSVIEMIPIKRIMIDAIAKPKICFLFFNQWISHRRRFDLTNSALL
jgi:hypothetical protein